MDMTIRYNPLTKEHVIAVVDGTVSQEAVLDDASIQALRMGAGIPVEEPPRMEVQVTALRWANMGDHAVLAQEALAYDPQETVEALVTRAHRLTEPYHRHDPMDHLVLRVVEGTEPKRTNTNTVTAPGDPF